MSPPPLILASSSAARRGMLERAGLSFTVAAADLDEEGIAAKEYRCGATPQQICAALAREKAIAVSEKNPQALVLGADQMLHLEGKMYFKARTAEEAVETLMELAGHTHTLTSCAAFAKGGKVLEEFADAARMTMRAFDEGFARRYVDKIGEAATSCVGVYQYEGLGAWLFARVEGDGRTIEGLPLVPVLDFLWAQGYGP